MKEAFFKLHLSIFLAGFTGIFGKLISLNEGLLVWYRLMATSIIFGIILFLGGKLRKVSLKDFAKIGSAGFLLALHWVFFYASIKASNVSIGVVCFSLVGLCTALFDPLINKRKVSFKELLFSLITLVGVSIIFHFDVRYHLGIILVVISSALCALFSIFNQKIGKKHPAGTILEYEMIGGFLAISALLPIYLKFFPVETIIPSSLDLIYLVIFCLFCTIGLYMLQIQVLKKISAFTMNLSYNLEPVYSIVIAMIIFKEANDLNSSFYVGLLLIIFSVFLQTLSVMMERKKILPQT